MLPLLLLLAQQENRIDAWIKEIPGKVVIARVTVENGAYILPANLDERPVLANYFGQYEFRAQFVRTHAVNINVDFPGRPPLHFIVLNMPRLAEAAASEEEIIAHELGHIWLHAKGLRAPTYTPGMLACEAIHTGDTVQHVLIRRELVRRGFQPNKSFVKDLENAWKTLAKSPAQTKPPDDICLRLQRLSLLIDTELGLADGEWPARPEYRAKLTEADPLLDDLVTRLSRLLNRLELDNKIEYYSGLGAVRSASTLLIQQLVEKTKSDVVP